MAWSIVQPRPHLTVEHMRQAGVTITSGTAAFVEMLHDHTSPISGELYGALDLPATRYILQATQGAKSAYLAGVCG
jgi:hypothetical protein